MYGQALRGRPWARPLLDGIVDDWLPPLADLLATGDRQAVDAAMTRFQDLLRR